MQSGNRSAILNSISKQLRAFVGSSSTDTQLLLRRVHRLVQIGNHAQPSSLVPWFDFGHSNNLTTLLCLATSPHVIHIKSRRPIHFMSASMPPATEFIKAHQFTGSTLNLHIYVIICKCKFCFSFAKRMICCKKLSKRHHAKMPSQATCQPKTVCFVKYWGMRLRRCCNLHTDGRDLSAAANEVHGKGLPSCSRPSTIHSSDPSHQLRSSQNTSIQRPKRNINCDSSVCLRKEMTAIP